MSEWKDMNHNFTELHENESVITAFPELKKIFNDYSGEYREFVFRYIIAYYNPKSPIRLESDIIKRKREAALKAGFEFNSKGRFPKFVEDLLVGNISGVDKMVVDYCFLVGSIDFTLLATYEHGLYIEMINMMSGQGINKDSIKKIKEIQSEIDSLQSKILAKDNMMKTLLDALYNVTDRIRLELRPEDIAKKLKKGEKPVNVNPYGADYDFKEKYGKKGSLREV